MANLNSILKSRDTTLGTKLHLVKAMVFPVVMYGCDSWAIKNAENRRIDAFELWCWRRLFRVPWTAERSDTDNSIGNQPWIFIGRTDVEADAPILWPCDTRSQLLEKILMLGKIKDGSRGDGRGWDGWMASLKQWTWVLASSGNSEGQGSLVCCSPWGHKESNMSEQKNNNKDIQGGLQNNNNTHVREIHVSFFNNYNFIASLIFCNVH